MSFFDKLKSQAAGAMNQGARSAAGAAQQAAGNLGGSGKSVPISFPSLPGTRMEFSALPQAAMQTPFETAAMFIVALSVYKDNKDESIAMMNFLKGPQPLSGREISFIAERMAQNNKIGFLAQSYFTGATPQNNYAPSQPWTVTVSENPYSYQEQGYARLFVPSGGADGARPILMRQAKDGRWYLWEFSGLLADIRPPESSNPWA